MHRFNGCQLRARRRMRFEILGSRRRRLRQVREATRREIAYANALGKPVTYFHELAMGDS